MTQEQALRIIRSWHGTFGGMKYAKYRDKEDFRVEYLTDSGTQLLRMLVRLDEYGIEVRAERIIEGMAEEFVGQKYPRIGVLIGRLKQKSEGGVAVPEWMRRLGQGRIVKHTGRDVYGVIEMGAECYVHFYCPLKQAGELKHEWRCVDPKQLSPSEITAATEGEAADLLEEWAELHKTSSPDMFGQPPWGVMDSVGSAP